jgi:hypothetical protein
VGSGRIMSSAIAAGGASAVADVDTGSSIKLSVRLVGDLDGNNTVTFADLLALAQNYNRTGRDWSHGDLNYDGSVNFIDLLALAQHYGQTAAAGSSPAMTAAADDPTVLVRSRSRRALRLLKP